MIAPQPNPREGTKVSKKGTQRFPTLRKVLATPRRQDVARPPRPCSKGEGALAASKIPHSSCSLCFFMPFVLKQGDWPLRRRTAASARPPYHRRLSAPLRLCVKNPPRLRLAWPPPLGKETTETTCKNNSGDNRLEVVWKVVFIHCPSCSPMRRASAKPVRGSPWFISSQRNQPQTDTDALRLRLRKFSRGGQATRSGRIQHKENKDF